MISLLLAIWSLALLVSASLYAGVVTVQSVRRVVRGRSEHVAAPALRV